MRGVPDDDPFAAALDPAGGEWMQVHVWAPAETSARVLQLLREELGFAEIDDCVLQTPGLARADYAPCDPIVEDYHDEPRRPR